MVDSNASSGSPEETQNPNPDGNEPSESDLTLDALTRKVQESLLLERNISFGKPNQLGNLRM